MANYVFTMSNLLQYSFLTNQIHLSPLKIVPDTCLCISSAAEGFACLNLHHLKHFMEPLGL